MNLRDDWWRDKGICRVLSDWFSRYLLGLFISFKVEGQARSIVYTGFLLGHNNHLFWATAGHVIDEINRLLADSNRRTLAMLWLDLCETPGAESVVVHNRDLLTFSASKSGIDFGVAVIAGLDAANILKNKRVRIITAQAWKNLHLARPEGYYILGYPQQWIEVERQRISADRVRGSARVNLSILPVKRIEFSGPDPTDQFWDDPDAFYGQILTFTDGSGHQPEDITGMSGGPLISVERDVTQGIVYRLFGIQRSWKSDERLIRAEPIHRIIDIIKT